MSAQPIRLTPANAARYARLRLRMLTAAPWAFAASPEDDVALSLTRLTELLAEEQNAIFAIEAADALSEKPSDALESPDRPELIAAAGVFRMKNPKFAHRAKIWGVFVEPAYRGKGLGRAVVSAAVELARTWPGVDYIDLGVSENAPEARRLYESLGFEVWGREPEATDVAGRRYDELHMTLRL